MLYNTNTLKQKNQYNEYDLQSRTMKKQSNSSTYQATASHNNSEEKVLVEKNLEKESLQVKEIEVSSSIPPNQFEVEKMLMSGIVEILIQQGCLTEAEGMKAKQLIAKDNGWR